MGDMLSCRSKACGKDNGGRRVFCGKIENALPANTDHGLKIVYSRCISATMHKLMSHIGDTSLVSWLCVGSPDGRRDVVG